MGHRYNERYGDDPVVSVLGNEKVMAGVWLVLTAAAGLSAFWSDGELDLRTNSLLWVLCAEGSVALIFGLHRSLFFNFINGLSGLFLFTLVSAGALSGDMTALSNGVQVIAMLLALYVGTGVCIVLSMAAQARDERRNIVTGAAR